MSELTLGRWIRDRARTTPARVAIDCGGEVTTYAELDARSDRLAAGLLEAGLAPGDRVATLTATSPEHVVVFFACAKAGLILMPLNTRLAAPELRYQLEDAEPSVLLCSPEFAELGASLHERTAPLEALQQSVAKSLPEPEDGDGLLLVYTSGTTGKPKGALLTHANCFWTNLSFDRVAGLSAEDTVLQVLPQFHVGGWNVQPLLAWWKGATVVLEPAFDPARALAADRREAGDDDDGRSRDVPLHGAGSRLREGGSLDAAARGRRRRADAGGAARDVARARASRSSRATA